MSFESREPPPITKAIDAPPPQTGGPGAREKAMRRTPGRLRRLLKLVGPGLIAGASDDDPATLGTCASAGAALGVVPLWVMLFTTPLMITVQFLCAKLGQVTGRGLTAVLGKHFSRWLLYPVVVALVLANVVNAGADLGAIAAAINMLVPVIPAGYLIVPVALVILALQSWCTYCTIERIFTWLALSLAGYVAAGFLSSPDWDTVFWYTFVPHIELSRDFLEVLVALLGTTFAPYLFFWQSDQEVEEKMAMGRRGLLRRRGTTDAELHYTGWDIGIGMGASNVVTYFIILATAATLHRAGVHDVNTPEAAARALRPLAGPAAQYLLAAGLIGGGFLAIPVLTTSAAYALAETFGWKYSLDRTPGRAKRFYLVIALMTTAAAALNYTGIPPMRALVLTSTIYGFLAPPLLILLLVATNRRAIMGERTNGWLLNALGGIAALATCAGALGLVVTWLLP